MEEDIMTIRMYMTNPEVIPEELMEALTNVLDFCESRATQADGNYFTTF